MKELKLGLALTEVDTVRVTEKAELAGKYLLELLGVPTVIVTGGRNGKVEVLACNGDLESCYNHVGDSINDGLHGF